jgi:condensin-2 complex subunit G2
MEASLGASTPALAASLRRVLAVGLHSRKHLAGVDAALLELWEPLLFRALGAANPAVRRNALGAMVDVFPLRARLRALSCSRLLLLPGVLSFDILSKTF